MVSNSITMDGPQSPAEDRRLVASASVVLVLAATAVALLLFFQLDAGTALLSAAIIFSLCAVAVVVILGLRSQSLTQSRDRLVRLERAMSAASVVLLKRDVADPVGTALVALVEGVEASSVFLDSVGDRKPIKLVLPQRYATSFVRRRQESLRVGTSCRGE